MIRQYLYQRSDFARRNQHGDGQEAFVQPLDELIDPFFTACCLAVRRSKQADKAAGQTAKNQGPPADRSRQDRILRQDANFTELDVLSCLVPLLQGFYGFPGGRLTVEEGECQLPVFLSHCSRPCCYTWWLR